MHGLDEGLWVIRASNVCGKLAQLVGSLERSW